MKTASFTSRMAATLLTLVLLLPGWTEVWGQNQTGHSVTLCENGALRAFGRNAACQVGLGFTSGSVYSTPQPVPGINTAVAVSIGNSHSLALLDDGSVWAWGDNTQGCSGMAAPPTTVCSPTLVANIPGCVVAVAAGKSFSLALLTDGTIWGWGLDNFGQLGNGTGISSTPHIPVQVSGITNAIAIAAGFEHAMALLADGTVWAWGSGGSGQLGNGLVTGSFSPVQVLTATATPLTNVVQIAAGGTHNIALKSDNRVCTWGLNLSGELGRGSIAQGNFAAPPTGILTTGTIIDIAAGDGFSMVLKSGGTTRVTGANNDKQLGLLTPSSTNTFITGPLITNGIDISIGSMSKNGFAINSSGQLFAWGYNNFGQVGNGTTTDVSTPVLINASDVDAMPSPANRPQPCCVAVREDERTVIGTNEYSVTTLGANTTYNTLNMAIFGTVIINANVVVNFTTCDVVMGKNAKIILNSGARLYVQTNSHLYACGDMWDGIQVKNNARIWVQTGSIIEDAEVAVDIEYGAQYTLNNATFNRNYIHVRKTMPPSGTPIHILDYRIVKCKFRCHTTPTGGAYANLLPPRTSDITLSAIQAIGVPKILVGNTLANQNTFVNSAFGVSASGVPKVEVLFNTFTDVDWYGTTVVDCPNIAGATILINDNTYNRSLNAIYCYDNGTTVRARIKNNKINFAGMGTPAPLGMRGIEVTEIAVPAPGIFNYWDISNNTISLAPTGIHLQNLRGEQINTTASIYVYLNKITHTRNSSDPGAGIQLQNVFQSSIVDNDVTHPNGDVNWWEIGIRVSNGNSNGLFCNKLHHIGNGLWFDGFQTTNTIVATNEFDANGTGMLLNYADIGAQPLVATSAPHDNQWINPPFWNLASNPNTNVLGVYGHTTQFRVSTASSSVYYPDDNAYQTFGTPVAVSVIGGAWNNSCQFYAGPSFKTDGSGGVAPSEEPFAAVVAPQDAQSERERGQQWMGQYGLYDKLVLDEELRSTSATLEAFYSESNASTIGVLQRAVSGFEQTSEATAQSQEQLVALQSISPANSIEQTLVEVMSVLYSNAASLIAMNHEDEALLRNVALRCPLDDGFGVYMARSALLKLDTLPKNYFNECELVSKPIHEQEKLVGGFNKVFSVYPNPSSGHFTVNYQINELETGTIEVIDLVGKKVFAQPLHQGVETIDLQLNHLSGGTYFLRLQTNGQLRYSDRISIIKL